MAQLQGLICGQSVTSRTVNCGLFKKAAYIKAAINQVRKIHYTSEPGAVPSNAGSSHLGRHQTGPNAVLTHLPSTENIAHLGGPKGKSPTTHPNAVLYCFNLSWGQRFSKENL